MKLIKSEQIKVVEKGKEVDFDRYDIEVGSQISTKEYSIVVDFKNKEITGDCVAYGSWYDIEEKEAVELLKEVMKNNKPIRDFTGLL